MDVVLIVIIVFILVIALMSVLVWQMGAKSQTPRKLANGDSPEVGTRWEKHSFMSHGSRLEGWLLQPANDALLVAGLAPLVVIAHGWGSNRTRVLRYTRPIYEAGYSVFMYDARSHGDSESIAAPSALMFRDDVLAAVEAARRLPGIDTRRIAVIGHSLGGFGALLALDRGLRVSCVITDSMPVRFETMMKSELRRKKIPIFPLAYLIPRIWLIRAKISLSQFKEADIPNVLLRRAGKAGAGRTPVLMVHAEGDDFISSEDLKHLKDELPGGIVSILFVAGNGHSQSEQDPAFWESVLPFLQESVINENKKEARGTRLQASRENI
ncbi:pimeloyl-ACP methyl ester carboxylesterase [Paenibacillus endophyticus]|uniref:Pimeloyl-ACP methyl ester carboxylesterase n=1 Tax=Paenibacillus endophyticus TaxID=1294268 RepID=A0A7W5C472_9BACL|nr:alpha/beta fold hydrolase [Paenibacillus endophyticus]MBB3150917.1 pimeloyl-ACP methyl ester carboxylesterase [Paenibacillus endophyticus]